MPGFGFGISPYFRRGGGGPQLEMIFENFSEPVVFSDGVTPLDMTSLSDWNLFFSEAGLGFIPHTSIEIVGFKITLRGGSNATLPQYRSSVGGDCANIISFIDVGTISSATYGDEFSTSPASAKLTTFSSTSLAPPFLNYSFSGQLNLVSVYIPSFAGSMISTFSDCASLNTINIGLPTSLDGGVFQNCSSLSDINLQSVTSMTNGSNFKGAYLTSLNLDSLSSISGSDNFREITGSVSISLPSLTSVVSGQNTFYNSPGIVSIDMPALTSSVFALMFSLCSNLTSIRMASLTTIALNNVFQSLTSLQELYIPSVITKIGNTVANNNTFLNTIGNTITLTVKAELMTNNGGNPDGDIQYLQSNNTVTVIQV